MNKIDKRIHYIIMTDKELDLIKKILSVKGDIDKYVILCEDEQGRYIKYAFIDGEPHDNRCLSWYDKLQPKITDTARKLWELYFLLTIICATLLYFSGMSIFDAICHSFTTLASGGYSTKNASIAYWSSPLIHYIIIIFMIVAGTNFSLLYGAMIRKQGKRLIQDEEFRTYIYSILGVSLVVAVGLIFSRNFEGIKSVEVAFRDALFQIVATMTTQLGANPP